MAPIPNLDIHQHRAVARATGMLLWGWERPPHGTFEYRGHAMLHTLGFDPAVVQESAAFYTSRCLGDSEARIAEAMRRMLAGEPGVEVEFALLDAAGRERWFLASGAFATAEGGIPVLAGWTHEITRRKQVEVALADSTRMLAAAERMAGLGSWRLRLADGVVEFSEQGAVLLGLPVDAPVAPLDEISRRLDEDDRDRVLALVAACAERGEAYTCTHRIHRPDGTVRLARSSGEPMRDSLGVIVAVAGSTLDITDEEEAREQLVMLGSAIENANDAVAVLETDYESEALPFSTIRFANPCLCRLLGRDHTTLVGERIRVLFGPDTDLSAIARVQVALHRGEPLTEEFTFGRPDGTTVRVDARLVPIGGSGPTPRWWVVTLRDVTARREWEEALQRSEAQLRRAQRLAGFVEWRIDLRTGKVHVGEDYAAMYDVDVRDDGTLDVRRLRERMHPDDVALLDRAYETTLASTEPHRSAFRIVGRDGTVRRIVSIGTLVRDASGRPEAIHGVSIDDSDRIEREERLVRLKEEAESAARAKSAFLANMSHELRTPLNGVLGMLELLIAGSLEPTFERYARTAHASGASLLHLLDDILDLSKVEAGKLELVAAPFDPRALLVDACDLLRPRAEDRGLALRLEGVAALPAALVGDEWRIRQVLLNLLGNAIKFTEFGEVVVAASVETVADALRLHLVVRDTGIGIPTAVQARLFEPFAQGDSSTTRRFGGSGLGLSITRELVALMQGTVECTSVEGEGSTFRVALPVRRGGGGVVARPLVAAADADALVPPLRAALAGKRLLVVEDHAVNRTVVLEMLRPLDVAVDVAVDGAAGVAAVEATRYDLVLLDHQMPVMDGLTAAATIRRRAAALPGGVAPVLVAMTASAMRGDRERCLAAGMHDYLAKPLSREALFTMLTRHFVDGAAAAAGTHAAEAPLPHAGVGAPAAPSAASARIGEAMHALSNAVQAEDAEATRRLAATLVAVGRDVGDRALVDAARGLAVSVPPVGADWARLQTMTRALAQVASDAADRVAAADAMR